MARKEIAKITLYGNTVSWMDFCNCIYLTTNKPGKLVGIVYDDMNLDCIREGIAKCLIKVIEGEIPDSKPEQGEGGGDLPVDEAALEELVNEKVQEAIKDGVDLSGYATTQELADAITNLIGGADENSDTLKELADLLAGKADKGEVVAAEEATVQETIDLYK